MTNMEIGGMLLDILFPYRGASKTIRQGTFSMWDYENHGGQGSQRTGKYVIDRDNGMIDIIRFDQIMDTENTKTQSM